MSAKPVALPPGCARLSTSPIARGLPTLMNTIGIVDVRRLAATDALEPVGTLLPQHNGTAVIETHNVERVLADIDTNHGNRGADLLRHAVLLDFGAPGKLRLPAGQE